MPRNSLYAYFLGDDFSGFADRFVERATQFIQGQTWICSDVWVVNQRGSRTDGIPQWDLGFNLAVPDPYDEPPNWFRDVEDIVVFCIACRAEFDHDFEIGVSNNERHYSESIIEITATPPMLEYLRDFIGITPPDNVRNA